jgi:hypothetical protein
VIRDHPTKEVHGFCREVNQASIVGFDNDDDYVIGCNSVLLRKAVELINIPMKELWNSFALRYRGKKFRFQHYSGILSESLKAELFGNFAEVMKPVWFAPGDVSVEDFLKRHPYIQETSGSSCERSSDLNLEVVAKPSHPCFIDVVMHYIHSRGLENLIGYLRASSLVDQCKVKDGSMVSFYSNDNPNQFCFWRHWFLTC